MKIAKPLRPGERNIPQEPIRKPTKLKADPNGKLEIYTTLLKPDAWLVHECILGVSFQKRLIPVQAASGRGYAPDKVPTVLLTKKQADQIRERAKEHFHVFQTQGKLERRCVGDQIMLMTIDEYLSGLQKEFAAQAQTVLADI